MILWKGSPQIFFRKIGAEATDHLTKASICEKLARNFTFGSIHPFKLSLFFKKMFMPAINADKTVEYESWMAFSYQKLPAIKV